MSEQAKIIQKFPDTPSLLMPFKHLICTSCLICIQLRATKLKFKIISKQLKRKRFGLQPMVDDRKARCLNLWPLSIPHLDLSYG